ncbi:baseplate J/gp47 family protein [Ktedonobacter racemifer]|uniref:Baseplate protein J-like barrel domain-containing protein n=1 Tax=Ktedonobacter racemifer DSM 44963 TaxID=485913 RepID=D6TM97_KTERA|nr:baseplate J/gp47 family protein [Ktedonobacter racemifer]EFH86897.1 hypothetical protein Krac_8214 [Ktedonobacter racemifer DSM 44963]
MQDRQIQNDIDQLFHELDQQQNQHAHTTDDIPHIEANQEYDPNRQQWNVEIHIYPRAEPEEPTNVIESVPPIDQELQPGGRGPLQWMRQHTRPLVLLSVIICVCALVVGCLLYVSPFWTPTTTVTLVPVSHTLETRLIVSIGGSTDKTQSQVPGRILPVVTMSQARTIPITGKAHQDAQSAHGYITFYNNATYAQTIPAGTLLTATNGVQVVTDQDITVNAVSYPTLGQASVSAHATQAGPAGNLKAGAIYGPCCRVNISAVNGAFSGGQEARDYQTVTQHDIDIAGASLKSSLDQSTTAALQTQVQSTETLVTPLHCQQKMSADHQPGEEAASVHVTLDETCTGMVYQTQALQTFITQALTTQAKQQLGAGYTPSGDVHITTTAQGTTTIQATGTQTWVYQFSQAEQEHLKASIAGKSQAQAKSLLLARPGIQSVSLSNDAPLPDVDHIRLLFLTY